MTFVNPFKSGTSDLAERYNTHFGEDALEEAVARVTIGGEHFPQALRRSLPARGSHQFDALVDRWTTMNVHERVSYAARVIAADHLRQTDRQLILDAYQAICRGDLILSS
jgi:hypothetical protein